jgi:hypothetical protein
MNPDTLGHSLCDVWLTRLCSRNPPATSRLERRHHEAPVATPNAGRRDVHRLVRQSAASNGRSRSDFQHRPADSTDDQSTRRSNTKEPQCLRQTGVLKFSSDATVMFEPGQVLVSTSIPVTPQGFLRKVKTVRCED